MAFSDGKMGPVLKAAREARGISLEKLGKAMGISASTVGQIERGEIRCPPQARLGPAAKLLGVTQKLLLDADEGCAGKYGRKKPAAKKKATKKKKAAKKKSAAARKRRVLESL